MAAIYIPVRPYLRVPALATRRWITTNKDPHNQTFKLPDGRLLGFGEYGRTNGKPLLYFHGFPSSRIEPEPFDDLARKKGIRVLSLERPGFGLSSPQPRRTIMDWPRDVTAFADGMGLDKFAIMGLSGGGPYALACAHALPKERLTGVGLFASGPPWVAGRHHMSLSRRSLSFLSNSFPLGVRLVLSATVAGLNGLGNWGPLARRIDAWIEQAGRKANEKGQGSKGEPVAEKTDEEKKQAISARQNLLRVLFGEPFRQGSESTVWEAKLLSDDDWGFKFEDVDYNPVWIWHGEKDANAPAIMMRWLAERLPNCNYREWKNDTHYTMAHNLESSLYDLMGKEASKQ
jgi:pimeloyl-ACP methyl ester carboxylesterase